MVKHDVQVLEELERKKTLKSKRRFLLLGKLDQNTWQTPTSQVNLPNWFGALGFEVFATWQTGFPPPPSPQTGAGRTDQTLLLAGLLKRSLSEVN